MRKRTRKVLSIVLAAAMALSMNSMAFAAEAKQNEVTYKDGVAVINNATDPVSWNSAQSEAFSALLGHVEDDRFANGKVIGVSDNSGSASYNVIPLDVQGSYLLFGYSANTMIQVEGEGLLPAARYDSRKKVFKNGNASKDDALNGQIALVKYDASAKTVTKVDGVELTDFKMDKNNTNASVSNDATIEIKKGDKVVGHAHKKLGDQPTFTLKVKTKKLDSDVNKAVKKAIKEAKYSYAILPMAVTMTSYQDLTDSSGKISANEVRYWSEIESNIDASKLNVKNGKATLTFKVYYGSKSAVKKIKPADYTLRTETIGDTTLVIVDGFNSTNFEYGSPATWESGVCETVSEEDDEEYFEEKINYAEDGYKLCFREHGEKKNKEYRKGIYKSATDVFVKSVE